MGLGGGKEAGKAWSTFFTELVPWSERVLPSSGHLTTDIQESLAMCGLLGEALTVILYFSCISLESRLGKSMSGFRKVFWPLP